MYYVKKVFEIAGAHQLKLNYDSKCQNLHGHNWEITIYCKAENLDRNGMVVDFTKLKQIVVDQYDHKFLNDCAPFRGPNGLNPTAETMAFTLWAQLAQYGCYAVEVRESNGNWASYTSEGAKDESN